MVADLPDSVTFDAPDGRTFACSSTDTSKAKRLQEDGFLPSYDLTVIIRAALMVNLANVAEPIALRSKFTHAASGLKFRVDRIVDGADGVSVQLECVQVTS